MLEIVSSIEVCIKCQELYLVSSIFFSFGVCTCCKCRALCLVSRFLSTVEYMCMCAVSMPGMCQVSGYVSSIGCVSCVGYVSRQCQVFVKCRGMYQMSGMFLVSQFLTSVDCMCL